MPRNLESNPGEKADMDPKCNNMRTDNHSPFITDKHLDFDLNFQILEVRGNTSESYVQESVYTLVNESLAHHSKCVRDY